MVEKTKEFTREEEEITGTVEPEMTPEEQEALLREIEEHDKFNSENNGTRE